MLREDFLRDYGLTVSALAKALGVSRQFDNPKDGRGFIQGIRLPACPDAALVVHPRAFLPEGRYHLENPETGEIRESAVELGAPVIRVWAGARSPRTADAEYRAAVVANAIQIGKLAAQACICIAFEYHGNTLTETIASATELMQQVNGLALYWQPIKRTSVECITSLGAALPWLRNIHVFHWSNKSDGSVERQPLVQGANAWQQYFDILNTKPGERFALLEFVRDDSPEQFLADAAVLNRWLEGDWR